MIDDFLGGFVGEALFGRLRNTPRAQLIARLFFGLLGAVLGTVGAIHVMTDEPATSNGPLRASMVSLFISMACFSLFNVALARSWRWPGLCFLSCLGLMFATRLAFGA